MSECLPCQPAPRLLRAFHPFTRLVLEPYQRAYIGQGHGRSPLEDHIEKLPIVYRRVVEQAFAGTIHLACYRDLSCRT